MGQINWVKKDFPVLEMSCAACAVNVESVVAAQAGVRSASVNFANQSLHTEYDPAKVTPQALKKAVQAIGYDLIVEEDVGGEKQEQYKHTQYARLRRDTIWAGILSLPVFVIGMFFHHLPYGAWIMLILAAPTVFGFGRRFFLNAWKQARHGKANMDTLVALSTGIAFLFSVFNTVFPEFWTSRGLEPQLYYEAASVVVFFILTGKLLEERAKAGTSSAIKKLMGLQPTSVTLLQSNGNQKEIALSAVLAGDRLVVKPGAKIPVDGLVASGESYVDESMINGEPVPVFKTAGSKVFAGTLNQSGSFELLAESVGSATLLARIIQTVRDAQGSKAPVQKLADRVSGVFAIAVIGVSILTFALWMVFGGLNAFPHALLASITVLVIACPCALGLATPTALIAGIGRGAGFGILIKDAASLERAKEVSTIVLDKTGTLTVGKPALTGQHWFADQTDDLKKILFALESRSGHPLAGAVLEAFAENGGAAISLDNFKSIMGKGVQAQAGQARYAIGNQLFMSDLGINLPAAADELANQWQAEGKTVIYYAADRNLVSLFALADPLKPGSAVAVREMQGAGLKVYMLSGDNPATTMALAGQLGITDAQGGLLPAGKSAAIRALQAQGEVVAMVGDGINDAESMAQADVGIAMGTGSDIALETAGMTLLSSDLRQVLKALKLSGKTVTTIRQNLFWAFIYNLIGIPIAAGILYPFNGFLLSPMLAGGAMALSSVSVVANSLRLRSIAL